MRNLLSLRRAAVHLLGIPFRLLGIPVGLLVFLAVPSVLPGGQLMAAEALSITVTRSSRANLHDVAGKKTGSTALKPGMQFDLTHFDGKYYTVQFGPYSAKIPAKAATMDGAVEAPPGTTHRERRLRKVQTPWRTVGGTTYRSSSAGNTGSGTFTKTSEQASPWRSVGGVTTPVPRRGSVIGSSSRSHSTSYSHSTSGIAGPWRSLGSPPPARRSSIGYNSPDAPYVPRPLQPNEVAGEWRSLGSRPAGTIAPVIDPNALAGNRDPNLPLAKGPEDQPPPMATSWRYLGKPPPVPVKTNTIQMVRAGDQPEPEGLIENIEPIPREIIEQTMATPTPSLGAGGSGPAATGGGQMVEAGSPHPSTHLRMPKDRHRNPMLPATLSNKDGGVVQSSSLNGKMVGFYFTASWCGPCKVFTPPLIKFRDHYQNQFEIVMVGSDRSPEDHLAYMKKFNMPWPSTEHGSFASRFLYERYGVASVPTLIVVRPDGSTITTDGRTQLLDDPEAAFNRWQGDSQ